MLFWINSFYETNLKYIDTIFYSLGFKVTDVVIQNRKFLTLETMNEVFKEKNQTEHKNSIFRLNLQSIKKNGMDSKLFKELILKKVYPNIMQVYVLERKPLGFWHKNNQALLIDDHGDVLGDHTTISKYTLDVQINLKKNFFNFAGVNANLYANQLVTLIQGQIYITNNLSYAEYIENRRWNLVLKTGLTIKLPESLNKELLSKISQLLKHSNIENMEILDMRNQGKIYVKYK